MEHYWAVPYICLCTWHSFVTVALLTITLLLSQDKLAGVLPGILMAHSSQSWWWREGEPTHS